MARRGVHRGALTAAHVAQWAIATHELGHVPSTAEYVEFWAVSDRTGWYHRAEIREVFGDRWQDVIADVAARIGERRSPRVVMGLPVTV